VTITASQGTLTQAGSQSGTWSWSQSGLDEGTYTGDDHGDQRDGSTAQHQLERSR